jgi:hypothetical protein
VYDPRRPRIPHPPLLSAATQRFTLPRTQLKMVSAWSFRLLAALSIGALTAHATPLVAPAAPLAKVAPVVNDSSKHNLPVKVHVKFPIVDGPEADPSVDIDAILADYAEREAAAKLAASTSPEAAELFGSEQRGNTVAPTILSASAIPGFTPYSYYATTAYCKPSTILTWSCGREYRCLRLKT